MIQHQGTKTLAAKKTRAQDMNHKAIPEAKGRGDSVGLLGQVLVGFASPWCLGVEIPALVAAKGRAVIR